MLSQAFKYNAGLIRGDGLPISVSGDTGTLLDRHGNPIRALKRLDAIHRTDWQGRQLLYRTARTNGLLHSADVSSAPWGLNGTTLSAANSLADGMTAHHAANTTSASQSVYQTLPSGQITGNSQCVSAVLELGSEDTATYTTIGYYDTALASFVAEVYIQWSTGNLTQLAGGKSGAEKLADVGPNGGPVYRLWVSGSGIAGHNGRVYLYPARVVGQSVTLHGAQLEDGEEPTPFIVTADAALTVTDYTLTGTSVAFGEPPADDAPYDVTYDWTGVAIR